MGKRRSENANPVHLSLVDLERDFFIDDASFDVLDVIDAERRLNETIR